MCVDLNGKQIDGNTNDVLPMGNLKLNSGIWMESYNNWRCNLKSIIKKLNQAKKEANKNLPVCL